MMMSKMMSMMMIMIAKMIKMDWSCMIYISPAVANPSTMIARVSNDDNDRDDE